MRVRAISSVLSLRGSLWAGKGSTESNMSVFTPAEIEYFNSQRLGRLATQGASSDLHVVPARFRYNAETDTIDVFGGGMGVSKKYRDVGRTGRAAFVVDDVP